MEDLFRGPLTPAEQTLNLSSDTKDIARAIMALVGQRVDRIERADLPRVILLLMHAAARAASLDGAGKKAVVLYAGEQLIRERVQHDGVHAVLELWGILAPPLIESVYQASTGAYRIASQNCRCFKWLRRR